MNMADTQPKWATSDKWKKANTVHFGFRLFKTTDADILPYLDNTKNKQGFIKAALRYYIANGCPDMDTPDHSEDE